jgi:hypothetical protein
MTNCVVRLHASKPVRKQYMTIPFGNIKNLKHTLSSYHIVGVKTTNACERHTRIKQAEKFQ